MVIKGKQYITKGGIHMESKRNLHRYDIIDNRIKTIAKQELNEEKDDTK